MKITDRRAAEALIARKTKYISRNTRVENHGPYTALYYWDSPVARLEHKTGKVFVSLCGWGTPTTRNRVNAVCSLVRKWGEPNRMTFFQNKYEQFIHRGTWEEGATEPCDVYAEYFAGVVQ